MYIQWKRKMYNQGQHAIVFMEVLSMNEALKTQLKMVKNSLYGGQMKIIYGLIGKNFDKSKIVFENIKALDYNIY